MEFAETSKSNNENWAGLDLGKALANTLQRTNPLWLPAEGPVDYKSFIFNSFDSI